MAFTRIKTVRTKSGKSYQYRYLEYRWRDGKKVRSKSILIGAVRAIANFIEMNRTRTYGVDWESDELARQQQEEASRQAALDALHAAYGLTVGPNNPTPVDKAVPEPATDPNDVEADAEAAGAEAQGEDTGQP
jgi:hypothetical protein